MTLGLTEKARVTREADGTLHPCAWYLEEIDNKTLPKVPDLVNMAFA